MKANNFGAEKADLFRWIAAGCLAVMTVIQLVWTIRGISYLFQGMQLRYAVQDILHLASCIFGLVAVLMPGGKLVAAAMGVMTVVQLLLLLPVYGFLGFLAKLITLLSVAAVCAVCLVYTQSSLASQRETVKTLWFLPVSMAGLALLFFFFLHVFFSGALFRLAWAGAAFAIPVYVMLAEKENTEPAYDGFSQTIDTAYIGGTAASADVSTAPKKERPQKAAAGLASGRRGMVAHVLLLLLTFGIYGFVWIYQTTEYLNQDTEMEYRNPNTKLLLCIFVPFYVIYWTYQSALRMDDLAQENGIECDLGMLCLILSIFVGVIPPILIQAKMNELADVVEGVAAPKAKVKNEAARRSVNSATAANAAVSSAEALMKYKELLDNGVITEEEFQAKKKELLNL